MLLRWVNLLLVAALVGAAVLLWPELPERVPRHFNAAGEVDAWSAKTAASWFLLPGIAVFTVLLLEFSAWLVERRPEYINLPSKKQFLELPPEERAPIARAVVVFVQVLNLGMVLLFATIQLATYRAAFGQSTAGLLQAVLLLTVLLGPMLGIWLIVRVNGRVTEAHRSWRGRGGVPE